MPFTDAQRKRLEKHEWVVTTADIPNTMWALAAELARLGEISTDERGKEIPYKGKKIQVLPVERFITIQRLADNRRALSFKFTAFHREHDWQDWEKFGEGVNMAKGETREQKRADNRSAKQTREKVDKVKEANDKLALLSRSRTE
ncbi:MAG: hypothetical protein JWN37_378 [Candidatus Nomurabacteria bacterium]|nr:hypothetical protein [Candidatus Nomurabacteria bacterium]